jgi:NAD(P)-dependent dehydrogenase (short-subunit alcohol dehydrogenase family)
VWIIGASDGIGAALARAYAARGDRVILSARSAQRLEDLRTELGANQHLALPLDVSDRSSLDRAIQQLISLGPIDRAIHMAAAYDPGQISEIDPVTAARIVDVNLTGSFHVAQAVPQVLKPGGQLAICGSVAGYVGLPQGQIYSATKAGVINLVESLRAEMSDRLDIRLISPGFVDTRLTRRNDFTMPALQTPKSAAQEILRGLNGSRFEIHFPRRLTLALKLLRALPYSASMPLTRRLVR